MSKGTPGELFTVSIKVGMALVLGVLAVTFVVAYWLLPATRPALVFAAAVFGGAAAVYSAFYASLSLKESLAQRRRDYAFELTQAFLGIDRHKVRHLIDTELCDTRLSPSEVHEKILGDPDLLAGISLTLGQLELVSIAIQQGHADEETLFYSLSFMAPWAYYGLHHYIDETRRVDENPELYIELEKLADAWKDRKSVVIDKVFPSSRGTVVSKT